MFVIDANTLYVFFLALQNIIDSKVLLPAFRANYPASINQNTGAATRFVVWQNNLNSKVHSCSQKANISSHITPWALMRFAWIHIPVQCSDFSTLEGRHVVYYDWPEFRDHTCFVTTVQHYEERDSWRKGLSFYYSCRNSNHTAPESTTIANTHLKKKAAKQLNQLPLLSSYCTDKRVHKRVPYSYTISQSTLHDWNEWPLHGMWISGCSGDSDTAD